MVIFQQMLPVLSFGGLVMVMVSEVDLVQSRSVNQRNRARIHFFDRSVN